jgi:Mycobacterium membrane protein
MRTRRTLLAIAAAVLLVAAGCSDGSGGSVEPPTGGWPQPENGQITAKMCGLLTRADYEQFNHRLLLDLEPQGGEKGFTNGVSCSAPPADTLALALQPTAESAKIWYQGSLAGRKFQVISSKRDTVLVENLVAGADESWLDFWVDSGHDDKLKDYELQARRGALVMTLVLSGVDEAKEKDPKGTLVALADRVLQRVGDLGKTDTGATPMLHLEVNGNGKAGQIQYSVPDRESKTLNDVDLPWKIDLPLADHGKQLQTISLNAQSPITPGVPIRISCRILVDGKIINEKQDFGVAGCLGNLPR